MFADLHLHTCFSDGTYMPEDVARLAHQLGLKAIALTDHDTMEGCARMATACQGYGIEFIPASELTAELDDIELHLIGYFLDPQNGRLIQELAKFQTVRQERIYEMTRKINSMGVALRAESVFELASCRSPGRPHVARALVQQGFCGSLDEAFERFLRKGKPAWVPKFKISAYDAIELIHQAGGLAVMAHPGLNRTDEVIPTLVAAGLDGIECFHTKHSTTMTEHYLEIADKHKLLVTGGSDCHGMSKGKPLIGTIKVPYQLVEKLRDRAMQRAAENGFMLASERDKANEGGQT